MSALDRATVHADVDSRLRAWMDTQATPTGTTTELYDEVLDATRTARQRPRLLVARGNGATLQPADRAWPSGRLTVIAVVALALALALGLGALVGSRYLFQAVTPAAPGAFVPTDDIPLSVGYLIDPAIAVLHDGRVLMAGGGQEAGSALVYDPVAGTWSPPIPMRVIRQAATATTLDDGRVLIVGGNDGEAGVLDTAELFDPATDAFEPTGSMAVRRDFHTATLLDDGRVLIAGGHDYGAGTGDDIETTTSDAELYDPATGSFGAAGPLAVARAGHSATRLSDGRVAIIGGYSMDAQGLSTMVPQAEIFDPATNSFHTVGDSLTPRARHGAALLTGDRILVIGGDTTQMSGSYTTDAIASAEVFDPASGEFTVTGSLTTERGRPSVTRLLDGRVLVAGGRNGFGRPLSAEMFEPLEGTFESVGMAASEHIFGTAPLLANGRVFLPSGGQAPGSGSELFVPGGTTTRPDATSTPSAAADGGPFSPVTLTALRSEHTATLLADGHVLIIGGYGGDDGGVLETAEIFDPTTGTSDATGSMAVARAGHIATLLPDGRVMVSGGSDASTLAAEVYDPGTRTFSPASAKVLAALQGHGVFPVNGLAPGKLAISDDVSQSIAILDVATGDLGPFMKACYFRGGALALPDGTILEGCGADGDGMIYDPVAGTSRQVKLGAACGADPGTSVGRGLHRGDRCEFWEPSLLPDGRILAMTRQGGEVDAVRRSATLVYSPVTGTFTNIEPEGSTSPMAGTISVLANGDLLMVGGNWGNVSDAVRILNTSTWVYRDIGQLLTPRADATATTLHDGRVLIVGGMDRSPDRTVPLPPGAELFDPSRLP